MRYVRPSLCILPSINWAVLLILVQWSRDTSIFIKLGYEMYWKEKPISSEFSKRIQSSGKQRQASICPIHNLYYNSCFGDVTRHNNY